MKKRKRVVEQVRLSYEADDSGEGRMEIHMPPCDEATRLYVSQQMLAQAREQAPILGLAYSRACDEFEARLEAAARQQASVINGAAQELSAYLDQLEGKRPN